MFAPWNWLPKKMWKQMAVVLLFFVTIPLTLLGMLLIDTSQSAVKTSVLRGQEQLAVRAAGEVAEFIKRPRVLLGSTASILGTIHADPWKQETVLVELALNEEMFGRVSLTDLAGKELAASEPGTPLEDRSGDEAFRASRDGGFYMSDVHISTEHIPFVTMSVPVKQFGQVAAVLIAEVSLRSLWSMVDNIQIGRTGRAYVVSDKGVLVAHEDKKRVLANENLSRDTVVRRVLAGETGSLETAEPRGKKWLSAYAPISEIGWGVVMRQATEEAYSFLKLMKIESWLLILVSNIVAIFTSVVIARLLTKPIKLLVEKTKRVAQGDFESPLAIRRNDEIGNLLSAFNQMTETLKKAREAEKLTAIGKASAAIAHELKNSLVMAGTFIGLLPKRYKDEEFLMRFSRVVPQELESWKGMLRDISDFSRQSRFELVPVALEEWAGDLVFLIEGRLSQGGVRLEFTKNGPLPVIQANAQKLKQAFMNLIINAIEAMPRGGTLGFSIGVQADAGSGQCVEARIRDEGKGIPPDKLAHIFEPFFTTKTNGLGLGLAITHEIIQQHGGRIEVESLPQGTAFTVCLPAGSFVVAG